MNSKTAKHDLKIVALDVKHRHKQTLQCIVALESGQLDVCKGLFLTKELISYSITWYTILEYKIEIKKKSTTYFHLCPIVIYGRPKKHQRKIKGIKFMIFRIHGYDRCKMH